MNELQIEILNLYKKLAKLFEENNIRYFAIGGTAIGAFREKGFISWDDDVDIAIFEDDLDKFKKAIEESDFIFGDKGEYGWRPFFKVSDPNTKIKQHGSELFLHIDVFISFKKRKITKWTFTRRSIQRFLMWTKVNTGSYLREGERSVGNKVVWLWYFGMMFPKYLIPVFARRKNWQKKAINLFKNKPLIDDGRGYLYHSGPYDTMISLDLSKIDYLPFEDTTMPVTSKFGEDSFQVFGDIMKPHQDSKTGGNHNYEIIRKEN